MKKNKNLIYLLLLVGGAVAFIAFKKKPKTKLRGRVEVPDLETITEQEFKTETQPDILIREVKDAVESTPNPLDIAIKKAKKIFVKNPPPPIKNTFNDAFKNARQARLKTFIFNGKSYNTNLAITKKKDIPKIKPAKKVKPIPKGKKRVKGFDDISVLY